jgi:hypothetical protein
MGRMKESAPDLFAYRAPILPCPPKEKAFDGSTYEPGRDHLRLKGQLGRVFDLMRDGKSRTIPDIADAIGGSEAAVSARLRDFRKEKYGAHQVERTSLGHGLFTYRLIVNQGQ